MMKSRLAQASQDSARPGHRCEPISMRLSASAYRNGERLKVKRLNFEFEIPEEWLTEDLGDWLRNRRESPAYRAMTPPYPPDPQDGGIPQVEASVVPLQIIEPVHRTLSTGTPFESRERLLRIFSGIKDNQPLPPIHTLEAPPGPYGLNLYNGLHRLFASVAAGFTHIPVVVSPRFKP